MSQKSKVKFFCERLTLESTVVPVGYPCLLEDDSATMAMMSRDSSKSSAGCKCDKCSRVQRFKVITH